MADFKKTIATVRAKVADAAGGHLMATRESRRAAELKALRAELEKQLDQLDFRSESMAPAFAEMARRVERVLRETEC